MIAWAKPVFWGNEQRYVQEALQSTWISGGPFVDRLEREIGYYCDRPYAVTSSNGTTALEMVYIALGVGQGDEVIVPGFAFMAAANVALHLGAHPVFAEVDPATWCLDARDIEGRITARTKAIVAVHSYGNVCAMDDIVALGDKHGVPIIEDAAESFASRHRSRLAGSIAAHACFSFQATKTISTGEGGMVVTADQAAYSTMQLYRSHGMSKTRYWHDVPGHNFRLTNMQAALGCAQFEALDRIVVERKRVHATYVRRLADTTALTMQHFTAEVDPVLWAFAVKLDPGAYPQGRDAVMEHLGSLGIETRPGFYAASQMRHIYPNCPPLPVCEDLSRHLLSLPTYPTLRDEEIEQICSALERARR